MKRRGAPFASAVPEMFDIGRLLRIRGSIREVLGSVAAGFSGAEAMLAAHERLSQEAADCLPADSALREEFERLFPRIDHPPDVLHMGSMGWSPEAAIGFNAQARAQLSSLAGWLDGLLEEAQMRFNAQAYAEQRLKAERGIGFQ